MPIHEPGIWSRRFAVVTFTAVLIVSRLPAIVEASREDQDPSEEPFEGVKEDIQQKLTKAAANLEKSSLAQAAVTKKVAGHIGEYHNHVKNIASTMGQVLQAKSSLTKAYHEDMKKGEETRVGPLEVNLPEVLGEDFNLPQGDFSAFSRQAPPVDQRTAPSNPNDAESEERFDNANHELESEVLDSNTATQSNHHIRFQGTEDDGVMGPPGMDGDLPSQDPENLPSQDLPFGAGTEGQSFAEQHNVHDDTEAADRSDRDARQRHTRESDTETADPDVVEEDVNEDREDQNTATNNQNAATNAGHQIPSLDEVDRDEERDNVADPSDSTPEWERREDQRSQNMHNDFGGFDENWDPEAQGNHFDNRGASSLSQLEESPSSPQADEASSLSQLDAETDAQEEEEEDMEQARQLQQQQRLLSRKQKLQHKKRSLPSNTGKSRKAGRKAASHDRSQDEEEPAPARHRTNSAVPVSLYETTGMKGTVKNREMRRKLYRNHARRIANAGTKWKVRAAHHPRQRKDSIAVNPRSFVRHRRHRQDDDE